MSNRHSAPCIAKEPLAAAAGLLRQLTMAALHVQVRARFQGDPPQIVANRAGIMAHAAVDGQASLRAMSHYCLEQLLPRVQSMMIQVEEAAERAAALAETSAADLVPQLNGIAANLEQARGSLRGRARSPHNSAGMIRLSEQRLWGALAVELQRLEGADGPMICACARIEPAAFELAAAIEAFLERGDGIALAQRHDLAQILVRLENQAAATLLSRDEIARQLGPMAGRLPQLVGLLAGLSQEYRPLREAAPQIAMALSIATQTATQSRVTQRLEQAMQDLCRLLGGLVTDYRALARSAQRPRGIAAARQLIAAEAPLWHAAAKVLADPPALVPDTPAACSVARIEGRAGLHGQAMVRA
ncbi:hypothetical protein ACDP63_11945 [Paracoccus sp. P2]|uniref:Uncharacterized protein n=1 Tax=Paracoccus pantotrophus TaxID=82367 RepID=A0A1I5GWM7_PARPN|nr:hypothetical protein [Paracoccus pantotrophus]MDF3854545.1 hypothetical protein [Paracoccus pantotrophus]QLH15985.1 hypothetical protein HYQ43_17825 [Paracoccus pantotrophus]RKS51046.1 hypothetical protein BDE18_0272 [Paracoccus pantotrophus]SFO40428.1 hypothetical protein SAMN04244567_01649 [Paracoccus pantotrophus]